MKISINDHYINRRLSGLSRYANQINIVLDSIGCKKLYISIPNWLYANKSQYTSALIRPLRFIVLNLTELLLPTIYLFSRRADIHISPAFASALPWFSNKCIVVFHDLSFLEYPVFYGLLDRTYYKLNLFLLKINSQTIVTPSEDVKNKLCRTIYISRDRVYVIPPFSSLGKYSHNKPRKKGRTFILLSNGHPRKNIEATIRGFLDSKSIDNGYCLKILGNFESLPYFPPSDSILISNSVSDKVLEEELECASALLLFSFSEGFGIPIIEAAFCGTISLTSETSSLRELIDPNREATIALTHADITKKINHYLDSIEYREELERDRQYVISLYSEERFKENWRSLLENLHGGC